MKKTTNFTMLLVGIVQMILGIWLIFADINLASLVFKLLGIAFLVAGLTQIISTMVGTNKGDYLEKNVFSGALCGVIGIILLTNSDLVLGVTTIIIGVWLMISGALQLSASFTIKNLGFRFWPIMTVLGAIIMVLGYLLITAKADAIGAILNLYIGISLAISGLGSIVTAFTANSSMTRVTVIKKYSGKNEANDDIIGENTADTNVEHNNTDETL